MKATKNRLGAHIPSILLCMILALSYGCASAPDGRVVLHPAKYRMEGYTRSADQWIFENGNVNIRVLHIRPGGGGPDVIGSALVSELHKREYLLLRLVIRNDSDFNIIYNPALTTFKDGKLGYKKPLDYTDLYSIFARGTGDVDLKNHSRLFYDLSAMIRPGERASRLLVFTPPNKKTRKGELAIQNLYVEKEIINVSFPFVLRVEKGL